MTRTDFLSRDELEGVGFASLGPGVQLSRHALILAPERISVGRQTRIDAFCIVSGSPDGVRIGSNVHLSAFTSILGQGATEIEDFCTLSVRCSVFTSNDDYSGLTLTNPTVPADLRGTTTRPVRIMRHAILGAGCVILPGVTIGESAAVGALSLVKANVPAFAVVAGVPARVIGQRRREHLVHAAEYLAMAPGEPSIPTTLANDAGRR